MLRLSIRRANLKLNAVGLHVHVNAEVFDFYLHLQHLDLEEGSSDKRCLRQAVGYTLDMPKRSSKKKPQKEALDSLREATEAAAPASAAEAVEVEKNPAAVALGRLGGLKGGKARAAKLTPEQRAEIAKKAAAKRWGNSAD
jgi:hypothetical protein